jgi:MFS family permease
MSDSVIFNQENDSIYFNNNEEEIELLNNNNYNKKKSNYLRNFFKLILLCLINILNYTDRYIISSVLIDLQRYFDIDKSTAGLLQTSFLLSFNLTAPLVGYLGDRYNRKYLLSISCLLWLGSIIVGSFTLSNQFGLFIFTRCCFGVSTSFYECISIPIISDLYQNNPKNRTRALFLFYLGPPLGTGIAFLLANTIEDFIGVSDWRYVMRLTPFVLFLFFVLILFIFNNETSQKLQYNNEYHSFLNDLKLLLKNKTYILILLSTACLISSLVAFNWWSPTYLTYILKSQSKTDEEIGNFKEIYSIFQILSGFLGTLIFSELSNLFQNKYDCILISVGSILSSFILYIFLVTSNLDSYLYIFIYSLLTLFINCWRVLLANILLNIIDPRLKSTATSLLLFSIHLIGDSSSPFWIGFINQECLNRFDSKNSLSNLIYCTQISLYPLVYLLFLGFSFALFSSITFIKDSIQSF